MITSLPRLELIPAGDTGPDLGPVLQEWKENERVVASGGTCPTGWWLKWRGCATFWFGETGDVRAMPARTDLEPVVRDIFTRGIVPTVLVARGFEALHASAVLAPSGVVGLCGISGTGKSTLALALTRLGFQHFADDAVVHGLDDTRPVVVTLPFPVRVDEHARQAIGATFASHVSIPSAPFHGVYLLVRDTTVDPYSPVFVDIEPPKRFARLLAYTHRFEMGGPNRRRQLVETLLTTAAQVPVWECRFAPDLQALPALAAAVRSHVCDT